MTTKEVFHDTFNLLCGKELGRGIHRTVFACNLRPDLVVKVEDDERRYFANAFESKFWGDHEHCESISRWLAPVKYLSPDARVLLQVRCEPVPQSYQLPDKLPEFLTDHKRENFGLLDGRLVCVDYAMTIPNPSRRLKKAHW